MVIHILFIKDMRLAAKELGMEKEWMKEYTSFEMIRCIACGRIA